MSHASLLIALDPVEMDLAAGDVDTAIAWQMEPFDENGEWFKSGSRWDWYVVGGRFTGQLSGYDPATDQRNFAICKWCGGTGQRKYMVIVGGCNGCDGTGTARNFSNQEHGGDKMLRGALDLNALHQANIESYTRNYRMAERRNADGKFIYGVDPKEETLAEYLARFTGKPEQAVAHHAFVRNRHWHESERMGWFGTSAATECEIKAETADVEVMVRRCKHKDKKTGAHLVVWQEPWEVWSLEFYKRFVEPLKPEALLVTVDDHV